MDTRLQAGVSKDDLLVSWKDIAAYLKCSVRKAQRLEEQELPVNRIPETKSVWAFKSEIDRWLTVQADKAKHAERAADSGPRRFPSRPNATVQRMRMPIQFAVLVLAGMTMVSAVHRAYGMTTLLFVITTAGVALVYPLLMDTAYTRAIVGLFIVAGMAFVARATTLPDLISSVVNMKTLRPSATYPFVLGLRFIPILVVTSMFWAVLRFNERGFVRRGRFAKAYLWTGTLSLISVLTLDLALSGAHRIWQAGLSIRWTLLAGESFIFAINAILLVIGYRFFCSPSVRNREFLSSYATGYLLIALTAAIVGRHWNDIDKYYLDVRQPVPYHVHDPNAVHDLQQWLQQHTTDAGADLKSLANDSDFLNDLQSRPFYKKEFDELFQTSSKAVIFGYKRLDSRDGHSGFVVIRFPAELARILRLEQ